MSDGVETESVVTRSTRVEIGIGIVLVGFLLGAVAWGNNLERSQADRQRDLEAKQAQQQHHSELFQQEMRSQNRELKLQLERVLDLVASQAQAANDSGWPKSDHSDWSLRFQLLNPSIRVPDPQNGNRPYDLARLAGPSP